MTTQQATKPPVQGAATSKNATLKKVESKSKKDLTPEERAEKIGYLAQGKTRRDKIIQTRKELEAMKFGSDPNECELVIRAKNGEKFQTTNPRIAEIFVDEAINYCNVKTLEVDKLIEDEIKTLTV